MKLEQLQVNPHLPHLPLVTTLKSNLWNDTFFKTKK